MKCNPIPEREDWFICERKPTICPRCGKKEVKKSVFGMPSAEDYYEAKYHFQGCIPDFPCPRTWGCCNCDAAFFKNTQENLDDLNGVLRRKSEPEEGEKLIKRTQKEKDELMKGVMEKWVKEYKEGNLEIPF